MSLALSPLLALAACCALHLLALRLFPRWKLLDFPERYGLTRTRLPYPTGILAVLTFVPFFLVLFPMTVQNLGLLGAVLLLAASCFLDDRTPLPPVLRLSIQLIAALLIFLTGSCIGSQVCSITNPLPGILGGEQLDPRPNAHAMDHPRDRRCTRVCRHLYDIVARAHHECAELV
jgi:UDP-N-acetylmuramyl pentapeptide phosphotransferase/UDP-N-acetylglucosamine-1-phosphate transferase